MRGYNHPNALMSFSLFEKTYFMLFVVVISNNFQHTLFSPPHFVLFFISIQLFATSCLPFILYVPDNLVSIEIHLSSRSILLLSRVFSLSLRPYQPLISSPTADHHPFSFFPKKKPRPLPLSNRSNWNSITLYEIHSCVNGRYILSTNYYTKVTECSWTFGVIGIGFKGIYDLDREKRNPVKHIDRGFHMTIKR